MKEEQISGKWYWIYWNLMPQMMIKLGRNTEYNEDSTFWFSSRDFLPLTTITTRTCDSLFSCRLWCGDSDGSLSSHLGNVSQSCCPPWWWPDRCPVSTLTPSSPVTESLSEEVPWTLHWEVTPVVGGPSPADCPLVPGRLGHSDKVMQETQLFTQ